MEKSRELHVLVAQEGRRPVDTECAHIIPESTNWDIAEGSDKVCLFSLEYLPTDILDIGALRRIRMGCPEALWL